MPYRRGSIIISGAHPSDKLDTSFVQAYQGCALMREAETRDQSKCFMIWQAICVDSRSETREMGFVKVASAEELKSGSMKGVDVGGKQVLLANLEGKYYAIGNVCTHLGCMLSDGRLNGETVRCPCHGSIFNVKTGGVVQGPAERPAPMFQVKLVRDQVLVSA